MAIYNITRNECGSVTITTEELGVESNILLVRTYKVNPFETWDGQDISSPNDMYLNQNLYTSEESLDDSNINKEWVIIHDGESLDIKATCGLNLLVIGKGTYANNVLMPTPSTGSVVNFEEDERFTVDTNEEDFEYEAVFNECCIRDCYHDLLIDLLCENPSDCDTCDLYDLLKAQTLYNFYFSLVNEQFGYNTPLGGLLYNPNTIQKYIQLDTIQKQILKLCRKINSECSPKRQTNIKTKKGGDCGC